MDDQFDNRELIIEYLESGCKGGDMGYIGVEIEQFVLDEDGDRVPYIEKHGRLGVRDILEQLSPYYSEVVRNEEGDILSLFRLDSNVTIEPAALPRPGPTGMPALFAKFTKSHTIRK